MGHVYVPWGQPCPFIQILYSLGATLANMPKQNSSDVIRMEGFVNRGSQEYEKRELRKRLKIEMYVIYIFCNLYMLVNI